MELSQALCQIYETVKNGLVSAVMLACVPGFFWFFLFYRSHVLCLNHSGKHQFLRKIKTQKVVLTTLSLSRILQDFSNQREMG